MGTLCVPFKHARATSSTSTGFTAKIPTVTKPSGSGIIDLLLEANGLGGGCFVPDWFQLVPYATDGDNDTFDFRVYGWNRTVDSTPVWIPQLLLDVSVVIGNISGAAIGTGVFMPDTFTLNDGPLDGDGAFEHSPWVSVISPAEDLPGSIMLHARGCQLFEFDWDLAGGQEAVAMNCLYRPVTL